MTTLVRSIAQTTVTAAVIVAAVFLSSPLANASSEPATAGHAHHRTNCGAQGVCV